jgi:hypothetical protein
MRFLRMEGPKTRIGSDGFMELMRQPRLQRRYSQCDPPGGASDHGQTRSGFMRRSLIPLCLIPLLAACDQQQPTHAPGSSQDSPARASPEGGSPANPQGGIPAGQSDPQRPTGAGDSQQPPRQ